VQYKKIELVGILAHTSPRENARAEIFFTRNYFSKSRRHFSSSSHCLSAASVVQRALLLLALHARAPISSGGT
jgi:hypothetical protein